MINTLVSSVLSSQANISLLVVLVCCAALLIKRNYQRERQFPSPKGIPILGNILQVDLERYVETFRKWHADKGDTFEASFLLFNFVDSVDPKVVSAVIHGTGRDDLYKYTLNDIMGRRSIIMNDGQLWRSHRNLLVPSFSTHKLQQLMATDPSFVEAPAEHLIRRLNTVANTGKPYLMDYETARATLAVMGKAVFHYDFEYTNSNVGDKEVPFLQVLWDGSDEYNKRMSDPTRAYINPVAIKKFNNLMNTFTTLVKEHIKARTDCHNMNSQGVKYNDCLGVLLEAYWKGETPEGVKMTEKDVVDNVITLLVAGHETTAHTLSFALFHIAQNPEVETKLISTLDAFGRDRPITYDDLLTGDLQYVGQVINETLRVKPVAPSIIRKIHAGQNIGNVVADKDYNVGVTLPFLHMDERLWPDPEKFDPERFDAAKEDNRPVTSYLPFGGGPRTCLGKKLALLELKYLLASLYRNFTFELVPNFTYDVVIKGTMHETHSMPLLVKSRVVV